MCEKDSRESSESMAERRTVVPLSVDMRHGCLREACARALQGTITPMLVLYNHGCEEACADLAACAQKHLKIGTGPTDQTELQRAHLLEGPCAAKADSLRQCLLDNVCGPVLDACLSPKARAKEVLAQARLELCGRLCLREYPYQPSATGVRIGAHIDSTLMTLLWADGPGLEVLSPPELPSGQTIDDGEALNHTAHAAGGEGSAGSWTGEQVMSTGFPGLDGICREVREEEWAAVALPGEEPWSPGPLLLTIGSDWLSFPPTAEGLPVESAVLHRVAVPTDYARDRFSLPFLVTLRPIQEGPSQGLPANRRRLA
jgi:hypothetical protein